MLAESTLRVESFSVAKQALSLPSSSHSNARVAPQAAEREVEGDVFLGRAPSAEEPSAAAQAPVATATAKPTTEASESSPNKEASDEAKAAAHRETLEKAREAERKRLEKITEELNEKLNQNLSLRFGEDKKTGVDYFQLVEKETGDVVQQIPSQDMLDFVQKFKDFSGLLFNQDA